MVFRIRGEDGNAVIITFDEGKAAVYSAALLYQSSQGADASLPDYDEE